VWRKRTQVQKVFSLEDRKEDVSNRKSSACDHAIRGAAKEIEEKSSMCPMTKSIGVLWREHSR